MSVTIALIVSLCAQLNTASIQSKVTVRLDRKCKVGGVK